MSNTSSPWWADAYCLIVPGWESSFSLEGPPGFEVTLTDDLMELVIEQWEGNAPNSEHVMFIGSLDRAVDDLIENFEKEQWLAWADYLEGQAARLRLRLQVEICTRRTFQWYLGDVAIAGATTEFYTPKSGDPAPSLRMLRREWRWAGDKLLADEILAFHEVEGGRNR